MGRPRARLGESPPSKRTSPRSVLDRLEGLRTLILGSPSFAPLAIPSGILLVLVIVLRRHDLKKGAKRDRFLITIAAIAVLAFLTGAFVYAGYADYAATNSWKFEYVVRLQTNATSPQSVIVPVPSDRDLLRGLQTYTGAANLTWTDTAYGVGLTIQFSAPTGVYDSYNVFPPPNPPPNTTLTLANATNIGVPQVWVYYSGSAGTFFFLRIASWTTGYTYPYLTVTAWLVPGWHSYRVYQNQMLP